jgi:hypothetical protein
MIIILNNTTDNKLLQKNPLLQFSKNYSLNNQCQFFCLKTGNEGWELTPATKETLFK